MCFCTYGESVKIELNNSAQLKCENVLKQLDLVSAVEVIFRVSKLFSLHLQSFCETINDGRLLSGNVIDMNGFCE